MGQSGFIMGEPNLAYWEVGNKEDIVIVLHGGPCVEHQYLRPEFDQLKKSCRVIYYDQRGCGMSSKADTYDWVDHVKDLNRLIDSLSPDRKVFLAGSSWGSLLALLYAYKHPSDLEGLILSGLVNWGGKGLNKIDNYDLDVIFGLEKKDTIYLKPATTGKEVKKMAIANRGRPAGEPLHSMRTAPPLDNLRNIELPILIFQEDAHCIASSDIEKFVKILPNTTLFKISGTCHDTWLSNPKLFFKVSNKFIRSILKHQ